MAVMTSFKIDAKIPDSIGINSTVFSCTKKHWVKPVPAKISVNYFNHMMPRCKSFNTVALQYFCLYDNVFKCLSRYSLHSVWWDFDVTLIITVPTSLKFATSRVKLCGSDVYYDCTLEGVTVFLHANLGISSYLEIQLVAVLLLTFIDTMPLFWSVMVTYAAD